MIKATPLLGLLVFLGACASKPSRILSLQRNGFALSVYLPKDYETSTRHYPVLYMHDGQNLFDRDASFGRDGQQEWEVDETFDASCQAPLVIGIHARLDRRGREYDASSLEGREYLKFIIEDLKPFIDRSYRTLPGTQDTFMAGSSLGGLITFQAGVRHPETFGRLGVFSPSFWASPTTLQNLPEELRKGARRQEFYFYVGDSENRKLPDGSSVAMLENTQQALEILRAGKIPVTLQIGKEATHGPRAWRAAFPEFTRWLKQSFDRCP